MPRPKQNVGRCKSEGCPRLAISLGLCRKHYYQQYRAQKGPCSVEGCEKREYARGLCSSHYAEVAKDGTGNHHRPPAVCAPELDFFLYKFPPYEGNIKWRKPFFELFPGRPMWGSPRRGWYDASTGGRPSVTRDGRAGETEYIDHR